MAQEYPWNPYAASSTAYGMVGPPAAGGAAPAVPRRFRGPSERLPWGFGGWPTVPTTSAAPYPPAGGAGVLGGAFALSGVSPAAAWKKYQQQQGIGSKPDKLLAASAPGAGGGAYYPPAGGGSPGGGPAGGPMMSPWAGAIPGMPFIPWTNWEQTPWANAPQGRGAEAMQWFNTVLPWQQALTQQQQWAQEFAQRQAMDLFSQQFQGQQFDWQKTIDQWSRELQQQQIRQQEEEAALAAFGRRWAPRSRWM